MKFFILFFTFVIFCGNIFAADGFFSNINLRPLKKADIGFALYDIKAGKNVMALNNDKKFYFASNLKLLTTAASLEKLGGGFRFFTLYLYNPKNRTLYIKSAGNPSFVIEDMFHLVKELKARKMTNIKKIVVDDYFYGKSGYREIVGGGEGDNAYLAYISPLSVNYNAIEIIITPNRLGKKVNVLLTTPKRHFIIKNSAVTSRGGGNRLVVGTRKLGLKTESPYGTDILRCLSG